MLVFHCYLGEVEYMSFLSFQPLNPWWYLFRAKRCRILIGFGLSHFSVGARPGTQLPFSGEGLAGDSWRIHGKFLPLRNNSQPLDHLS